MGEIGSVTLPGGRRVPALGQGTWRMGEDPDRRAAETAALEPSPRSAGMLLSIAMSSAAPGRPAAASAARIAVRVTPRRSGAWAMGPW